MTIEQQLREISQVLSEGQDGVARIRVYGPSKRRAELLWVTARELERITADLYAAIAAPEGGEAVDKQG